MAKSPELLARAKRAVDLINMRSRTEIDKHLAQLVITTEVGKLPGHAIENVSNLFALLVVAKEIGSLPTGVDLLNVKGKPVTITSYPDLEWYLVALSERANVLHNGRVQLLGEAHDLIAQAQAADVTDERYELLLGTVLAFSESVAKVFSRYVGDLPNEITPPPPME